MNQLFACAYIPDFPVAVLLQGEDSQPAPPCLASVGKAPAAFVYAANAAARETGIHPGMPVGQAEGRFALHSDGQTELRVRPRDEPGEDKTQRALLDLALTISPRVDGQEEGLLVVDLSGLPDPHASASQLAHRIEAMGLPVNVAVSRNRFVAACAARTQSGVTHVYPGQEKGFLHSLGVGVLPLEFSEYETLKRWGIRSIGEFARLPADSLTARFGERGTYLAKLAIGEDDTVFQAWQAVHVFEQSADFDWGISELDPLSFPVAELLRSLCKRLKSHALAADAVRVTLRLTDKTRYERTVALRDPLVDPDALLKLIRLEIAAHPPGDAVEGITLTIQPVARRVLQHHLFAPARPSPEKLAVTLARLKDLLGSSQVGTPVVSDSNRPRSFAVAPFDPSDASAETPVPSPAVGLRCFRPPVEAEVLERHAKPAYVNSRVVTGPVHQCAGPWRTSGNWWTEDAWSWQEWDVELSRGIYRLCCQMNSRQWQLVGAYD